MDVNTNSYSGAIDFVGNPNDFGAAFALMGAIYLVVFLVAYVYSAICFVKIAKKAGVASEWWAWIPILNVLLMFKIARKPLWWIVLLIIPLVNIIVLILVWMAIAEAVHKPNWWGILTIVPVVSLIVPGYLAFSKDETSTSVPSGTLPPMA